MHDNVDRSSVTSSKIIREVKEVKEEDADYTPSECRWYQFQIANDTAKTKTKIITDFHESYQTI